MRCAADHRGARPPHPAVLALAATLFSISCEGPPGAELCPYEAELLAADAAYVTLELQDTIQLDGRLAANMSEVLARARRVDPHLYRLHAYPTYVPDRLLLRSERPEIAQAWESGQLMTGVGDVDRLLLEYAATQVTASGSLFRQFELTFAEVLHAPRLLERFTAVDGISGEVDWIAGDTGSEIHAVQNGSDWTVSFVLGWSDCLSGCIDHHGWDVLVPEDGSPAVLLREWGETYDYWLEACIPVAPARR